MDLVATRSTLLLRCKQSIKAVTHRFWMVFNILDISGTSGENDKAGSSVYFMMYTLGCTGAEIR